ncbi:hypothetical protein RRG08_011818 [Elysia crispata]|uniref:Uncharacterized protein n=1 Tax=Elysia crispata TaxID=231223 RepID=A0AAE0ZKI3_9GAST|nr:hypothetical protein RRG08_011818 [Elysia crispata]
MEFCRETDREGCSTAEKQTEKYGVLQRNRQRTIDGEINLSVIGEATLDCYISRVLNLNQTEVWGHSALEYNSLINRSQSGAKSKSLSFRGSDGDSCGRHVDLSHDSNIM